MKATGIQLCYRHIITSKQDDMFSQAVLKSSYQEFLLKSQAYNTDGSCKTFTELKAKDGRANSLHYKTGFAASGFIQTLDNKIPVLTDNLGKPVLFENWQFELIGSDITDISQHEVAIHFFTPQLYMHYSLADYLVLSALPVNHSGNSIESFTIQLQPYLSISSVQSFLEVNN